MFIKIHSNRNDKGISIYVTISPFDYEISFCKVQLYFMIVVVQSLSHVRLFGTPWTVAHQATLSFTISQSLLKFMSIESVMLSNHLILWHYLLLLPSIFPSIRELRNINYHLYFINNILYLYNVLLPKRETGDEEGRHPMINQCLRSHGEPWRTWIPALQIINLFVLF